MAVKVLQLHKRSVYKYDQIQDKFSCNLDKRTYGICDGTTQSFNSGLWAELIVNKFSLSPIFDKTKLINSFSAEVKKYKEQKFLYSDNQAIASIEKAKRLKGGTTTFIGIQFNKSNRIRYISCGDSNLFIIKDGSISAYPFNDLNLLDSNSQFINTEALSLGEVLKGSFNEGNVEIKDDEVVIMASDALRPLQKQGPYILLIFLGICVLYFGF